MRIFVVTALMTAMFFVGAFAKTYKLKDGTTISGKVVSTNGNNVVIEDDRGNARILSRELFVDLDQGLSSANTNSQNTQGKGKELQGSYRGFAIGLSLLDLILTPVLTGGEATALYNTMEFAIGSNFALQIDIGLILGQSGTGGLQFGGGFRWYFSGEGLQNGWLGAYFDAYGSSWGEGFETALVVGYKFVLGNLFFDPFVGFRILSDKYDGVSPGLRFGANLGLCF